MSGPRRFTVSLRVFLTALVVIGLGYLAAIVIVLSARVGRPTRELQVYSRDVARVHDGITRRMQTLEARVEEARRTVSRVGRGIVAPPSLLDAIALSGAAAVRGVPTAMRLELAEAARAESDAHSALLDAITALRLGRVSQSESLIASAESLQTRTTKHLAEAQRLSLSDVVEREADLTRVAAGASRLVLWWIVVGLLLAGLAAWAVHVRVYRPLAALEGGLGRIARGDLAAEVPVRREDEVGRLSRHFNAMTEVLRARAEDERRRRENLVERFGRLLDESANEIYVFDRDTLHFLQVNRGAREHLGYDHAELRERTPLDILREFGEPAFRKLLAPLRAGDRGRIRLSAVHTRKDGSTYPVELDLQYSTADDPPVFVAVAQDVTELRRAERLRAALARFPHTHGRLLSGGDLPAALRAITETAAHAIGCERVSVWTYVAGSRRLLCLDLFERKADRHGTEADLTAADAPAYFAALESERTLDIDDAATDPRTVELADYLRPRTITALLDAPVRVGAHLAGVICHEHVGDAPRRWTAEEAAFAGSMADLVSLALEAADRVRVELALRESEERFRTAFEQAGVGMAEIDPDGHYRQVNPRFCRLLGYPAETLRTLTVTDVTHPDDRASDAELLQRLRTGDAPVISREKRYTTQDGRIVWAHVTSAPVHDPAGRLQAILSVIEDVTERRSLQEQVLQSQRMESVGRLAGGVAHDFNNLLTAILGYLELAKTSLRRDEPVYADLEEVERAARRAAELTSQLLVFARRHVVEPRVLDLNALFSGVERLLRRLIGERITLATRLGAGIGTVRADRGQMEQVLVNLAVNARDAMPAGGTLTIATDEVVLAPAGPGRPPDLSAGTYVRLSVSDTGVGMTPEVVERVFEPFFTTKEPGKGTGLGLATCYGIVRQAGGHIRAASTPGKGSRFEVLLPSVDARPDALEGGASAPAPRGAETILLAEDEPAVRDLALRTLRAQGYTVLTAADADQAERAADAHAGGIDLLVTDLRMPRRDGRELAARLVERRPDLRVLYISGYTGDPSGDAALLEGDLDFLAKPFTPATLARRVREALDGVPRGT